VGVSRDGPTFSEYPLLSQERVKLRTSNLAGIFYSQGLCEQKSLKNWGEQGALAYPGTSQIFKVPHIISGTRKAMNFNFGRYSYRVHPNKSFKNLGEKGARAYPWTTEFF